MMWPPMGFLGSALNIDCAPSTCATTWLVMTTATPNCIQFRCVGDPGTRCEHVMARACVPRLLEPHLVSEPQQVAEEARQVHLPRG